MYAMQCIRHCVFLFFVFVFGVCCCSLVAAGTCKADTHPTQPGICIEHMLIEEEEEKREGWHGGVGVCMVVGGDFFILFIFFFLQLQRALCAGGVGRS